MIMQNFVNISQTQLVKQDSKQNNNEPNRSFSFKKLMSSAKSYNEQESATKKESSLCSPKVKAIESK